MKVRLAQAYEAEICWEIRNRAIRAGCHESYDDAIIQRWTPDIMPDSFRKVIMINPFFVVENADGKLCATGFLDLSSASIEAIFTLPELRGKGLACLILDAIKIRALQCGFRQLRLSSTPNAVKFYEKQGFVAERDAYYYSKLAQAELRCVDMYIYLSPEL